LEQGQAVQRDRLSGQISLFAVMGQESKELHSKLELPDIPEWPVQERLAFEKETVGFYLTGHPLDDYREDILAITDTNLTEKKEWNEGQALRVGGLIRDLKIKKTKKGNQMGIITLEDISGTTEVVIFPELYSQCSEILESDTPIVIEGTVKKDERGDNIIANGVDVLAVAREKYTAAARIRLQSDRVSRQNLEALKKVFYRYHGPCPLSLTMHFVGRGEVDIEIQEGFTIKPCQEFTSEVNKTMGYQVISYDQKPVTVNQPRKRNGAWKNRGSAT
jgi:DNA polymerase-3 subunit alpha